MAILDQYGREIKSEKPFMEEIATARKDIDIFTGWLNRLENQDPVVLYESRGKGLRLYDEVERDAHAGSVLQTRYLAVVGKEWQVEPAGEQPKRGRRASVSQEQKIADFVKEALLNCNFDQGRQDLLQGILYGFYVAEVIWAYSKIDNQAAIVPARIRAKHPKRFTFAPDRAPRLLTPENQWDGEPLPDRKFIVFTFGSSDDPYGKGLGQKLWWPVWFKKNDIKFWLVFLEKFGSPTALGKYPPGIKPEKKAELLAALDAIQQETGIAIPDNMAVEFLEAQRRGTVDYEAMAKFMDAQISKAVLGQTATTEGTPGRLGSEEAQEEVRADILQADAGLQSECLNNSLIKWIVDYNFPGVTEHPKFWIRTEAEQNLKDLAERDKIILVDMGMGKRVPESYISETYGIPLAEEGEETIRVPERAGGMAPEFTESGFDSDQRELEELADDSLNSAAEAWRAIDAPVRKLIDSCSSLDELRDRIFDVYADLDPKDLEKLVHDALVTAALAGAADAGKPRKARKR
jgi:phage gp29-like protein